MFKNCCALLGAAVLSVSTAGIAQAQKNFQPGFIVPLSGDTLRGEVDSRGGQRMATLCLFRTAADPTQRRYSPTELKAYGFATGAHYESCPLPTAPGTPAALFLQVLAQGKATLYTYTDEEARTRYFFRKDRSGAVTELVQTQQNVPRGGVLVQEQAYPFRQVLSQAFAECFAVQPMLSKAELVDSKLVAIFDRYNTCDKAAPAAPATLLVRVSKVRFGVLAGVQSASTTLDDGGEVDVKSTLRPVIGVALLFQPATFNQKLAFRLEALYQTQVLTADYQRNAGVVTTLKSSRQATVTLKTLRVPLMLRYSLLLGKVQPYLQAGAMVAVLLDSHQALIAETNQVLGGAGTTTTVREIEMRGLGIGPTGAVGLLFPVGQGAVQVEARYDQLDSASKAANQLAGPQTTSLLLGYNF